jgi:DNA-3-methyladenine glycosylase II
VVAECGPPPFWMRSGGFTELVRIILEQQVSLASGRAALARLRRAVSPLTARRLLATDIEVLRGCGLTRQKSDYCRALARVIVDGRLKLKPLTTMPDDAVRAALTAVKGIGPWTADVYLLMGLGRPDVWPVGDRALVVAVREVKGLAADPSPDDFRDIGKPWRPWRAVAARILWHYYLATRPSKFESLK